MADGFTTQIVGADALLKQLEEYRKAARLSAYEVLLHQARNFTIHATREAWAIAPNKETLRKFLIQLARAGRLKQTKPGRTAAQEIARRIAAVGSIALGFAAARKALKGTTAADQVSRTVVLRTGAADLRLEGMRPMIEITNSVRGIVAADQKHGIIAKALTALTADIQVYLDRKAEEAKQKAKL